MGYGKNEQEVHSLEQIIHFLVSFQQLLGCRNGQVFRQNPFIFSLTFPFSLPVTSRHLPCFVSYIWHLVHFPCLYFSICLPFWLAPLTENCSDFLTSFLVFHPTLYSPSKPLRGCDLISPISVALLIAELVITIVIANTLQTFLHYRHHLSLCKSWLTTQSSYQP